MKAIPRNPCVVPLIALACCLALQTTIWPQVPPKISLGVPQETTDLASKPLADLLGTESMPIDLASAFRLAGVDNPQILLARQRVVEAVALRQLAAASFLPSLHAGISFDDHNGSLQQINGNILKVDRSSLYVGAGANAVGAGTVTIPGLVVNGNISQGIYGSLIAQQVVEQRRSNSRAVENQTLLRVGILHAEMMRAEGRVAVAKEVLKDAREVERLCTAFAKAGATKQADADRARTERFDREVELQQAEGEVLIMSARLAELLSLPPTLRLRSAEDKVVPSSIVPEPVPLTELLTIAILNRPELEERKAAIRASILALSGAKMLPFSPDVILALSYGGEAGGSNLVAQPVGTDPNSFGTSRFGNFGSRMDFDAVAFWSAKNLGLGNRAQVQLARSQLGISQLQFLEQLDRVRTEVAAAHARTHARFAQIGSAEEALKASSETFRADTQAVRGEVGRPIELLESLRLLARSKQAYLAVIVDYNEAQLELFVALGQPPADLLARPAPSQEKATRLP